MSGDVQPRKRKDKKKKRDDDESSHGVHITKMGTEDVHLHVHQEHGTGGHWCAKVFFFSLLAILFGVIGLIILENRGLSDLDTPLSQSRYSNYFDGWVEENRVEHEEHDAVQASIEEHDEHDEPFEEEEDQSEDNDDENATEEEEEDDHDEHDDEDDEDDDEQNVTAEAADDDDEEANNNGNVTAEEEEENDDDDNDDVENDDDNATAEEENDNNATAEDDDNEDNATAEEQNEEEDAEDEDDEQNATEEENATIEQTNDNDDEDNNNDDDDDNDNDNIDDDDEDDDDNNTNEPTIKATSQQQSNAANDNDDPFDEEDDDGTFESLENVVVDNDAEELLLLQEKSRQQAAEAAKNSPASAENDDDDDAAAEKSSSWASSLAVKIGVGVALAIVARLVLIRNNSITIEEPSPENLMKRRLTIASAEDVFPEDEDASPLLDDEYSDEEIEYVEEEEIEYIEEEVEEIEIDENGDKMPIIGTYAPETFEQLNAMYRSQDNEPALTEFNESPSTKTTRGGVNALQASASSSRQPASYQTRQSPAVFNAPPPPPIVEAKIQYNTQATAPPTATIEEIPKTSVSSTFTAESASPRTAKKNIANDSPRPVKREIGHDMSYQPEDAIDDIEYDYDDDEMIGEEEETEDDDEELLDDDDDISDVDDTELMSRLEAKYGRLPAKEFESDEDPDDPTWTQIKPKQTAAGSTDGPQAHDDDDDDDDFDMFEQELRRANEQMMRDLNYH